jgi:hypothetical protein
MFCIQLSCKEQAVIAVAQSAQRHLEFRQPSAPGNVRFIAVGSLGMKLFHTACSVPRRDAEGQNLGQRSVGNRLLGRHIQMLSRDTHRFIWRKFAKILRSWSTNRLRKLCDLDLGYHFAHQSWTPTFWYFFSLNP